MSITPPPPPPPATEASQPSEFHLRRAALVSQIGDSLEQVLSQINALNRGLEGIIEIGNEFASVEALWSQFEGVMSGPAAQNNGGGGGAQGQQQQQQQEGKDGDGNSRGAGDQDGESELAEGEEGPR